MGIEILRTESLTSRHTPNLPTNIIPTKIARLKLPGKSPMGMRIPPLIIQIMFESNPLKSIVLVRRLAVRGLPESEHARSALMIWFAGEPEKANHNHDNSDNMIITLIVYYTIIYYNIIT